VLGERRAERHVEAMLELCPDLLALVRVKIRVEGDVLHRVLQILLDVELLLRREVSVEHDASLLLLAEQPAPEGTPGGFSGPRRFSRRRAERGEAVFGAHGVAAADDHRVCGPGIAGLALDLLFYPRESRLVHAAQSSGLVLDAEQDEAPVLWLPIHPSLLR
jgi:hypothetical protein